MAHREEIIPTHFGTSSLIQRPTSPDGTDIKQPTLTVTDLAERKKEEERRRKREGERKGGRSHNATRETQRQSKKQQIDEVRESTLKTVRARFVCVYS